MPHPKSVEVRGKIPTNFSELEMTGLGDRGMELNKYPIALCKNLLLNWYPLKDNFFCWCFFLLQINVFSNSCSMFFFLLFVNMLISYKSYMLTFEKLFPLMMASKDFQVLNHVSNLKLFQAPSDTWLGTSQKKRTYNSGKSLGGMICNTQIMFQKLRAMWFP